jgi:cation diffusion facilitator CzcD-associated flavoprotein CzcO
MDVIIVGAGQAGTHIAQALTQEKHNVTLVDLDRQRLDRAEEVWTSARYAITVQARGCYRSAWFLADSSFSQSWYFSFPPSGEVADRDPER